MTATTPETFNADATIAEIFSSPEGRKDPYSRYKALRENTPIHGNAEGPLWYLSNFEDCRTALRDPHLGKTPQDVVRPSLDGAPESLRAQRSEDAPAPSMLFLNPPDHTRLRSLVSREFTPKRIDDLRPRMDALAAPMLDGMAAAGTADVMEELAWRLPVAVIGELVGVPEEDREAFRGTVRDLVVLLEVGATPEETERGVAAGARLRIYFRELIAKKRLNPTEDLLTALIAVEEEGDRLSEEELITTMILLFAAGFETTTNLIGNGLWLLMRNPEQFQLLREKPDLMGGFIEEVLRYESPVQLNARWTFDEIEIGGFTIPAGRTVVTFLGGANRDPQRFPNPEVFDIARTDNQPLSFGFGIHHCLGAHLARAEGKAVFEALLDRFSVIEPTEIDPPWHGFTLRGLERLPVRLH